METTETMRYRVNKNFGVFILEISLQFIILLFTCQCSEQGGDNTHSKRSWDHGKADPLQEVVAEGPSLCRDEIKRDSLLIQNSLVILNSDFTLDTRRRINIFTGTAGTDDNGKDHNGTEISPRMHFCWDIFV